MAMDADEAAELLGRALRDDRLAVLVGSGASAAAEEAHGRTYDGLPTPRQFVGLCSSQFGYVAENDDYNHACDKILDRDGRSALEEVILRYYQVPAAFEPPPVHRMLSWLPISVYLTSNYDQFIERSLEHEGRPYQVLIDNNDLIRLKRWQVPIVKYHGCVSRPASLVAATPDYDTLERDRSLVSDYIASSIAGKVLLVIGHGLRDQELGRILSGLADRLGEYAPTVFVLRPPNQSPRLPGLRFSVEVVLEDLTRFLSRLLQEARNIEQSLPGGVDERWMSSAFFAALRQATVLPSETQVIDTFLSHLQDEVSARDDVREVMADADAAIQLALDVRPNYEALRKTWSLILDRVGPVATTVEVETSLQDFRDSRMHQVAHFKRLGQQIIERNERVLLFSQSQRVIQALLGVPTSIQKSVHLFIAECRPKSPLPYQDAAATSQQLSETYFSVTVCPDMVAGHLLSTHQIDRIVMGTHAIFNDPASGVPHSFVNTCGARLLAESAERYGVPVDVIGERLKEESVAPLAAMDHVHIHQESDLLGSAIGLREIRTRRAHIEHLNIGYDLIPVSHGMRIHVADR